MSLYSYEAISSLGERIAGEETVGTERELAQILKARGFVLVKCSLRGEQKKFAVFDFLQTTFGVSLSEKLMFTRNLKVMVETGIPLPKALEVLVLQAVNKKFKRALQDVQGKIMQGHALSAAMEANSEVFSELFCNMVKVGEESGTLAAVLSQLSLQLEKQHELKSKIQNALVYPAVILVAMIGICILMLVLVVPRLAKTFKELNISLPLTTKFVIGIAGFITHQWYIVVALLLCAAFFMWKFSKTLKGRALKDRVLFVIPVISGIVRKVNAATTVRTLSSLMRAGVPIVRGLEITARVLASVQFQKALESAALRVAKGEKLSESLKAYPHLYSQLVIQMVAVGEETGKSSEVLSKLAEFYEEEVGNAAKAFASLVEPVLMLFIGAAVGFFAISMIQPMYSLLRGIQ